MRYPKVEPSAGEREIAHTMRGMFVALCNEGFTESQAIAVIGQMLAASMSGGGD